jgi:hypothetical protein
MQENMTAEGVVTVERLADGWLHVQIGRTRYVKRFNLRDAEARQLIEQLTPLLTGEGGFRPRH